MRRLLTSVVVLLALSMVGPAVAQDGTPAALDSLLAGMGYPELLVEVDGKRSGFLNRCRPVAPLSRWPMPVRNLGTGSCSGDQRV